MEKVKIRTLMFITVLLVLIPRIMCVPMMQPRPLCNSQFALVNHACSMLPLGPIGPNPPDTEQGNGHGPEDKFELENEHEHEHGHNRRHRRRQHHSHSGPLADCCKWLKELDALCVCELLFRLPPFLQAPAHAYTISVGQECEVTYKCSGRRA